MYDIHDLTNEEIIELKKIKELIESPDPESIKLGKQFLLNDFPVDNMYSSPYIQFGSMLIMGYSVKYSIDRNRDFSLVSDLSLMITNKYYYEDIFFITGTKETT